MDSKEQLAPSCDTLSTTPPKAQWNLQMSVSTVKQETVEFIDEEESPCSENTHPSEPLESLEYVNYYDSKIDVLEQLKKEFPEDKCSQSQCSMNGKIVSDNNELSKPIDKQEIKHENIDERLSLNIKEEDDIAYQFVIKTDNLEQPGTTGNAGDTSTNYILVTPQEEDILLLQKLQQSPKQDTRESMICEYCKQKYKLNNHMKLCRTGNEDEELKYICDSCGRIYVSKQTLTLHIKRTDHDNGKMINCWCGERFNTPIDLSEHKCVQHGVKKKNEKNDGYKCECCEAVFKIKRSVLRHMKRIHHDYGRTFECWCGKQFRTPLHLDDHKRSQHDRKIKTASNDKFQCDSCKKLFKYKHSLVKHIKKLHQDYGEIFKCWCGKQYRSPIQLDEHRNKKHVYVHEGFKFIFS